MADDESGTVTGT